MNTGSDIFDVNAFKRVELSDRKVLTEMVYQSKERSCEYNFTNLYVWGFPCETYWQIFRNRAYFWQKKNGDFFFTTDASLNNEPTLEELLLVSDAMRRAGHAGSFDHVRQETLDAVSGLDRYFTISPLEDAYVEYLYGIDELAELSGTKLAKKRNLIAQFKRDYPDHSVEPITEENLLQVLAFFRMWQELHPTPELPQIKEEAIAISHLKDDFNQLNAEGLLARARGFPAAAAIVSRISPGLYTEPFEKSLHLFKGAAQFINNELAKSLKGRCTVLNREQDLGQEGLRHAKLSYAPQELLCNFRLKRRETGVSA